MGMKRKEFGRLTKMSRERDGRRWRWRAPRRRTAAAWASFLERTKERKKKMKKPKNGEGGEGNFGQNERKREERERVRL